MLSKRSNCKSQRNINHDKYINPLLCSGRKTLSLLVIALCLSIPTGVVIAATPRELVKIPGGSFQMGDHFGFGAYGELPVHPVSLSSFYIGKYEVTNQQYCDFLNDSYPDKIVIDALNIYSVDDVTKSFPYYSLFNDVYGGSRIL